MDNEITESWKQALAYYNWTVNLRDFSERMFYNGYFEDIIESKNTQAFETKFRNSLNLNKEGAFITAGEVCFWKSYRSQQPSSLTLNILLWLAAQERWNIFVTALVKLAANPSFEAFETFKDACGQPNGFAIPITFLSFYQPALFPMVDKKIGFWWDANSDHYWKMNAPTFDRRSDGWLQPNQRNWNAYLEWTNFCRKYSILLTSLTQSFWRARDVEMAVWEAQKRNLRLDIL